jgi:hypothetical protein
MDVLFVDKGSEETADRPPQNKAAIDKELK